jgi:hypothetical protein
LELENKLWSCAIIQYRGHASPCGDALCAESSSHDWRVMECRGKGAACSAARKALEEPCLPLYWQQGGQKGEQQKQYRGVSLATLITSLRAVWNTPGNTRAQQHCSRRSTGHIFVRARGPSGLSQCAIILARCCRQGALAPSQVAVDTARSRRHLPTGLGNSIPAGGHRGYRDADGNRARLLRHGALDRRPQLVWVVVAAAAHRAAPRSALLAGGLKKSPSPSSARWAPAPHMLCAQQGRDNQAAALPAASVSTYLVIQVLAPAYEQS